MKRSSRLRLPALALTIGALVAGTAAAEVSASTGLTATGLAVTGEAGGATRLIVGYREDAAEATSDSALLRDARDKADDIIGDLRIERRLGTGAALVDLGGRAGTDELAEALATFRADPDVAYAVPDRRAVPAAVTPNDTKYTDQWDLTAKTAGMNVPGAWDKATGKGVPVAVIDTGYVAHSDLSGNIVAGYDFITNRATANDGGGRDSNPADPGDWMRRGDCGYDANGDPVPASDTHSSWHGTHVAGTIGAIADNKKGIAGIAYNAKVQPVRVLGWCGGATSDIIDAVTWSSGGTVPGVKDNSTPAKVLNLSLTITGSCDRALQDAVDDAVSRGATVVAAAGNDAKNVSGYAPANCGSVIAVAASDAKGNRASFSNYGSGIDVTAPGRDIWSTANTGTQSPDTEDYVTMSGTSMAAPHIAALAALMIEKNPALTPAQIEATVKKQARNLPGTCSGGCGDGLADAAATLGVLYGNGSDIAIPDGGVPVTSTVAVDRAGHAPSGLKVNVRIRHGYRGDLKVSLIAPDGSVFPLRSANRAKGTDLIATYTVDASQVLAKGTWKLQVTDVEAKDTGYVDAWGLTF
ncbi:S8 family serine peptidase [Streptomyces sp. f51]|uniref:S8 family serine peptidase n=1 Tax=Streptomyces sp. f51 TaxID=1827742 RepID=UPI00211D9E95|nr:S8 family serine peptidase [Streptomyces sp. f51]